MKIAFKYQVKDTNQNAKQIVDTNTKLKLIEAIDKDSVLVLPKKYHYNSKANKPSFVQKDTLNKVDSVYTNIEIEKPIQNKITHIQITKSPVEILFTPSLRNNQIYSWQIIILLINIIILGLAKAMNKNRFNHMIKSLFSMSTSNEILREEKVLFHPSTLIFTFVYIISFNYFLLVVSSITIIYLSKFITNSILTFVFEKTELTFQYIYTISIYNSLLGILIIPIISLIYFTTIKLSIVLFLFIIPLICITLILRILRLSNIAVQNNVSFLYIFLYICTLEIFPLVVLFNVLILKY